MTPPDPSSNEVLRLVALLRNQDQLIFKMSQCGSWEEMRPIFQTLLADTMRRMQDESDRIRTLMIPEIRKSYLHDTPTYSIQSQSPRLDGPSDPDQEGRDGHRNPTGKGD